MAVVQTETHQPHDVRHKVRSGDVNTTARVAMNAEVATVGKVIPDVCEPRRETIHKLALID